MEASKNRVDHIEGSQIVRNRSSRGYSKEVWNHLYFSWDPKFYLCPNTGTWINAIVNTIAGNVLIFSLVGLEAEE